MRVQIPPVVSGTPYRGIWGPKAPRGTSTSRAGSSVSIGDQRADPTGGADRAEAAGGALVGGEQAEQRRDDGRRAGHDRGGGPLPGHGHGRDAVSRGRGGELLAVAGHQQQRVVGGDAEDQHEQDAAARGR